ncbi:MAG: hypothetical protein ABIP93_05650 [Gemmatimonadaceae bacterium]
MTRRALLALALSTALAGGRSHPAAAQQVVFAAGLPTEIDSATQAALTRELEQARLRGLPVEPLVAKVREGRIKRAAPSRIRSAVAALAVRLDSARAALGVASSAAELVAGADALGAGANAEALRAVRAASGARDVAAPLGALAQLVATGMPARRATQLVVELLRHATAPDQLLAFGVAVEADVGAGVPAEESARFRLRAIEEARLLGGDKATLGATVDFSNTLPTVQNARPRRKP